ncbi:MAG TPA: type II secretion system protein GspG [Pyrinomonadaceae bacterium]|nr:type II secretion system protein GspG [Pyrinomonadaceae bacterium]
MLIPRHWFLLFLLLIVTPAVAYADLSSSQARKAIQSMGGISLPSDSVRVQRVSSSSAESAEATAELQLVFRATQHDGRWRLSEVRTAPDRWERLEYIAQAASGVASSPAGQAGNVGGDDCDAPSEFVRKADVSALTTKRARCLVAALFRVVLPSDDIRIREVSPFGLSFGSSDATALISSLVRLDFRFARAGRGWQVASVKSGNHDWIDVRGISAAVDQSKRSIAANDLSLIAQALDNYRRDRGFYVVSDKESVLIDHLSPRYLTPVIRLDPWHRPYQYDGEQTSYSLRSLGPDGKPNTSDDIVVKN